MTKIEAKIVAYSVSPRGEELITYELIFPRFLLAELNTHRMFSKNSASSRAIPFKKMVEMVKNDPFVPIAWQKHHSGMQGSEYWDVTIKGAPGELDHTNIPAKWLRARDTAVVMAEVLHDGPQGVTKQLCNRLLEPFMWHKVLLTTGKEGLRNFFSLRCPEYTSDKGEVFKSKKDFINAKDNKEEGFHYPVGQLGWLNINKGQAEIHMMELAESMYDTYNESIPQKLQEGQWHIPYEESIDEDVLVKLSPYFYVNSGGIVSSEISDNKRWMLEAQIKASTGLCARTSYLVVGDDKTPSVETLIGIHDKMAEAVPFHASPFEHCARVMTDDEYYLYSRGKDGSASHEHGWCRNYKDFIQYRELIETK
jgi:hypothetical protein